MDGRSVSISVLKIRKGAILNATNSIGKLLQDCSFIVYGSIQYEYYITVFLNFPVEVTFLR